MECKFCYSERVERVGQGAFCVCHACGKNWFDDELYQQSVPTAAKHFEKSRDYQHECEECHQLFYASRSKGVKFCSRECRAKHWRKEQLKPHVLLKNDPYQLERYRLLVELSPSSAEIVASAMAKSIQDGLTIMRACFSMPLSEGRPELRAIDEKYEMTISHLIAKRFAAVGTV